MSLACREADLHMLHSPSFATSDQRMLSPQPRAPLQKHTPYIQFLSTMRPFAAPTEFVEPWLHGSAQQPRSMRCKLI